MLHIFLHFLTPLLVAVGVERTRWQGPFFIMIATMAVDLDHLFASPIYDPMRCSIGFHPLHTFIPIILYGLVIFYKPLRWVGVGLVIHMLLDSIDCYTNTGSWVHTG